MHRHQQDVIAYLVEENRVLKEQLRGRKLRLTDDQRRRLAVKAKCLGRRALDAVAILVTPDTLRRWHRRLIAWKWTYAAKRVGRPGVRTVIAALIVRLARENDRWGYCRIQGELRKLGHRVAASTIGKVLKDHGIRPAPDRPTSWRTFLRAHWGEVAGMDFFTTEVWTPLGLTTYYVLFLIDLETRRAHVAGLTTTPDGAFIAQVAGNVTDAADGFLRAHRFVICDRDAKFTAEFRHILQVVGVEVILTPRHAPNCNAHAERVFEDLRTAPHVYLLPEYEDAESEREVLEDFWPELFAAMLTCWLTDEQQWPKDRTREMFREWFDVQMYPAVDDLHLDEELVELD